MYVNFRKVFNFLFTAVCSAVVGAFVFMSGGIKLAALVALLAVLLTRNPVICFGFAVGVGLASRYGWPVPSALGPLK